MYLLFLIALTGLWLLFVLLGMPIWLSLFILTISLLTYCVFPKSNKLQQEPLVVSKVILAISFWSCIALALKNYQQTLTCLNCMRSYLNTHLQPSFGTDFLSATKTIWQNYPGLLTMGGLLFLWNIFFVFILYKKGKAK